MKSLILLTLFLFSLSSSSNEKESATYYIIEDSAAPFQINNEKLKPSGLVSDILYAIASEDINIEPKVLPFNRMIQEMSSKDSGPWVSYGSKSWDGVQSEILSKNSIITIKHKLLTLKKNPYNKIEDLFGKRIAFIRGFQYPGLNQYVKDKAISVVTVPNHESAIRAVEIGRVFGFPEMGVRLKYHMKKNKINEDLFLYNDISKVITDYDINFCFSKDFPKYEIEKLDREIEAMEKAGKIKSIIDSYIN
ncbi:substrate-binding periplasmic protein [Halobacteriovorax sp.]|uniref:substrate-binding periplasmic protein n=1 Tax=Halobacteriovorax sp. TaxID=2020862 RepID=UPI00356994FB